MLRDIKGVSLSLTRGEILGSVCWVAQVLAEFETREMECLDIPHLWVTSPGSSTTCFYPSVCWILLSLKQGSSVNALDINVIAPPVSHSAVAAWHFRPHRLVAIFLHSLTALHFCFKTWGQAPSSADIPWHRCNTLFCIRENLQYPAVAGTYWAAVQQTEGLIRSLQGSMALFFINFNKLRL